MLLFVDVGDGTPASSIRMHAEAYPGYKNGDDDNGGTTATTTEAYLSRVERHFFVRGGHAVAIAVFDGGAGAKTTIFRPTTGILRRPVSANMYDDDRA